MKFALPSIAIMTVLLAVVPASLAFQPPANNADGNAEASNEVAATGDDLLAGADLERGKVVYQRTGLCVNCHGWNGNGLGKNPRSEGAAAMLRESELDTQSLIEVIRCGIPGTPMPYHDAQAYKDADVCFGMTVADFEPGTEPRRGKTFREKDLINLVAYLQSAIIGAGETTLEQCEAYFRPGATACRGLPTAAEVPAEP